MSSATRAREHYRRQQRVGLLAVRAVRRAVRAAARPEPALTAATTTLATYQALSASTAARTMAAEAGRDLLTAPLAFAGETALGYPVEYPLATILDRLVDEYSSDLSKATDQMMAALDLFVQSETIAAGADAASVEIALEPDWTNYVRVLVLPSCDRCVVLAGRIYRDLDGFARHPNCFPAGTVVSGPASRAATRRWYEGELIVLRTASGQELPLTGNHPILTDQGWVPANLLQVGDQVVRSTLSEGALPLVVPDEKQTPSLIEDVRGADGMVPFGVMPTAPEDFHGDGGNGEVDVVLADRFLDGGLKSPFAKGAKEEEFARRVAQALGLSGGGSREQLLVGMRNAANGLMGGGGLGRSFVRGHASRANLAGAGHVAELDALIQQSRADRVAGNPVAQAERVLALASQIRRRDVLAGQPFDSPRWDAPAGTFSTENAPGYAALGHDLRHRLSGQISLDRVVKLERVSFSGHVYNLTSAEGWFSANGLIVSNCDCQHWPVSSWAEAERKGLVTDPKVAFERGQVGGYRTLPDGSTRFESSLSQADEQAVRDGADLQAVVNAKRGGGRRPAGMTNAVTAEVFGRTVKATLEGTTARAAWRRRHPDLPIRLRPESIYEHAKDRDDAIRLLRLYGYLK